MSSKILWYHQKEFIKSIFNVDEKYIITKWERNNGLSYAISQMIEMYPKLSFNYFGAYFTYNQNYLKYTNCKYINNSDGYCGYANILIYEYGVYYPKIIEQPYDKIIIINTDLSIINILDNLKGKYIIHCPVHENENRHRKIKRILSHERN